MLIYGKNSCKEVLRKNIHIKKLYLQVDFNDKEILSIVQNNKLNQIQKIYYPYWKDLYYTILKYLVLMVMMNIHKIYQTYLLHF